MKIDILGTGCAKCKALFEVVKEALAKTGKFAEINKIEDIVEIMSYGVISTPALVVDGEVKMSGRVPSVDEVVEIISA
jgi:small redox-active disulfide protein 2